MLKKLFISMIFISIFCLSFDAFAQDYDTYRIDIKFEADWNELIYFGGMYENLTKPRGFRENAMKLTFSGSLSNFSVSPYRIGVYKYNQYDMKPVELSILIDIGKGDQQFTLATNLGNFGKISGKVYDLNGNQIGEFEHNGEPGYLSFKEHIIKITGSSSSQDIGNNVPSSSFLGQNYPNPFNPKTTINYKVNKLSEVKIQIYDSLGNIIKEIIDETKYPGSYSVDWDGKDEIGNLMPSGTYFYKVQVGDFFQSKKMILLK